MHSSEYLNNLDDSQRAAVEYIDGPSLVIAGAGAGKTRVLTSKIAYIIDSGIKPWNILALTFTNKAAREMRERIAAIVGFNMAKYINMGTFHSVFCRILRTEGGALGYSPDFTIYDRTDSNSLVKQIVKTMGLDAKIYKPAAVMSRISWAKNRLVMPDDYVSDQSILKRDSANNMPAVGKIYRLYQSRLKTSDAMDFDDLLVNMYELLSKHEDVRRKYAQRYEFVLVDEYQDTNYTQARILWLLTRERQKLCVVGDDSQSIYAFRGAYIGNILNFTKVFPSAKLFKLERNYRSTKCIVDAANSVIAHNQNRIPKDVYSLTGEGAKIKVTGTESDTEEAYVVAKEIDRLHIKECLDYNNMAVLYRRNAQSRSLEEAFRKEGIPYRIYGGLSFYERKEVKDVIAYFRLAVNPNDDEAFKRVVNYPARGIGATTIDRLLNAATSQGLSLWETATKTSLLKAGISPAVAKRINSFTAMADEFIRLAPTVNAYDMGMKIINESGVKAEIVNDLSDVNRRENLDELVNALSSFVQDSKEAGVAEADMTLKNYLAEVALLTDADKDDGTADRVTMMTIHAAKGLEFDAVLIVGVEDQIFPGSQAFYNAQELEEERRLFYVALTRAKRFCMISYARFRFSYGNLSESAPSRFLKEIPDEYLSSEKENTRFTHRLSAFEYDGGYSDRQSSYNNVSRQRIGKPLRPTGTRRIAANDPESIDEAKTQKGEIIKVGTIVSHSRFGRGEIKSITDAGDTVKVRIVFDNCGEKDLLLKFANINVIS